MFVRLFVYSFTVTSRYLDVSEGEAFFEVATHEVFDQDARVAIREGIAVRVFGDVTTGSGIRHGPLVVG